MDKKIWVRFYQVDCPEGVVFEKLLAKAKRKNTVERTIEVNKIPIRMAKITKEGGFYFGELVKIRMDGLPGVANRRKEDISDLNIQKDEGLGEESAFLFHIKSKVLVYQSNVAGVRESALCKYLLNFSEVDLPIILRPVLRQDAYDRFQNMSYIRKLEIKLAGGMPIIDSVGSNDSHTDMFRLMRTHKAGSLNVLLSVESPHDKKASLFGAKNLIDFFRDALSRGESDVKKLKVSGKENETLSTETVDLIDDIMKEQETLSSSTNRRYPYSTRKDAVKSAWDKNKSEIIQRFG